MIKVRDLSNWIKDNARGGSLTNPEGFINGDALTELAKKVKEMEPFDYIPRRKTKALHTSDNNMSRILDFQNDQPSNNARNDSV